MIYSKLVSGHILELKVIWKLNSMRPNLWEMRIWNRFCDCTFFMFFVVFSFMISNAPKQYKKLFLRSTCLGLGWILSQLFWPSTPSSVSSSCQGIEQGEKSSTGVIFEGNTNIFSALLQAVKMQAALQAAKRQGRRGGRPRRSRKSRFGQTSSKKKYIEFCILGRPPWLHPRPDQQGHLEHPDCVQQLDPEVRWGGPRLVVECADGLPLVLWWRLESGILGALIAKFGSPEIAPGMNWPQNEHLTVLRTCRNVGVIKLCESCWVGWAVLSCVCYCGVGLSEKASFSAADQFWRMVMKRADSELTQKLAPINNHLSGIRFDNMSGSSRSFGQDRGVPRSPTLQVGSYGIRISIKLWAYHQCLQIWVSQILIQVQYGSQGGLALPAPHKQDPP